MSGSRQPPHRSRQQRQRQLAWLGTAAGVISLAGAGWYWYSRWSASAAADADNGRVDASASTSASTSTSTSSSSKGPRPSLSLHLPPSSTHLATSQVAALYSALRSAYLVHLIHDEGTDVAFTNDDDSSTRTLAYSTHAGGIAITRALGCEAHLHVLSGDDATVSSTDELAESLLLVLKNPTLKLLVVAIPPEQPSRRASVDVDAVVTALQEAQAQQPRVALKVVDTRRERKGGNSGGGLDWGETVAQRMLEYRRAWR